ncbi:NUDIX hydrolase [Burkholderia sp. AW49-1]
MQSAFQVDDARVVPVGATAMPSPTVSARPVVATVGVLLHANRVLLVRRAHPPDAGRWCFPGGKIEFGETIDRALVRELREETGIDARVGQVLDVANVLEFSTDGQLLRHYIVLIMYCRWLMGEPVAGDDALDAAWFEIASLDQVELVTCIDIRRVIRSTQCIEDGGH